MCGILEGTLISLIGPGRVPCFAGSVVLLLVATVGALPLGFQVKLGLVRRKYIPAGLHAAETSYVSASSLSAFWAAIVRAV